MPITNHPSFVRPPVSIRLWRYTDLAKFIDLLTSRRIWLTNAEVLAADDPHEGLPGPIRFPHRMWASIQDVPEMLRRQIIAVNGRKEGTTPEEAFRSWFMLEEQACIMAQYGRRDFYVNCWHAAEHESAAMWKIYASPGAGVAVVTNGARIETSLGSDSRQLYLGAVEYRDPGVFQIGHQNAFDTLMVKRESYSYENEVRLVHWDTSDIHDAMANFSWNDERMRFDDLLEDHRPLTPGLSFECDLDVLIDQVIVSPFAPPWYQPMIERIRDQLGFKFQIKASKLLAAAAVIP